MESATFFDGHVECYRLSVDDLRSGVDVPEFVNEAQIRGLIAGGGMPEWGMKEGDVWVSQDRDGWIMVYSAYEGAKPDDEGNGVYMDDKGTYQLGPTGG